ncbi:hypothetical protein [Antarcticirhabdus aurantiaca]|uniref:Uncharacterized protein n=1 Tax=Antarcticirhabdus aurantiaca TaxID=2606717 RepID=A0ACD4NUI8_9HYPH|nr:hypothetical protein [Antarcticirhabdus aurantiaca]WAJ30486.1 hypothetical protein OXU80_09905 [Jeongeuplla avenae]
MSNISNNPLRQAGFHDIGQLTQARQAPQSGATSTPIARGHAPANSTFQGTISIRNAPAVNGAGATQAASQGRLAAMTSTIGTSLASAASSLSHAASAFGTSVSNAASALGTSLSNAASSAQAGIRSAASAVATAIDKKLFEPGRIAEQKFAAISAERDLLRDKLGAPNPNSILNKEITTAEGKHTVETFMKTYVASLHGKSNVTAQEVMTFVRMGEQIVTELYKGSDQDFRLPLTTTIDGRQVTIPSNLDTTRAVSWYLQAKCMSDNASPDRDNVQIHSGSMTVGDPGNRLYKYLSSAPNCYGRCSSHHERRSAMDGDRPATATKGFTAPLLHGLAKQPMQNGIEDFTNKFPSNGGTLLFDKLKDGVKGGELFMKWEEVGMPDAVGSGRVAKHGDTREEKATFTMAAGRCKGHMFNFLNRHSEKAGVARGEQGAKLAAAQTKLMKDFQTLVKKSDLSAEDKAAYGPDKKDHDVQSMYEGLAKMMQTAADKGHSIASYQKMIGRVDDLDAKVGDGGGDLHIGRQATLINDFRSMVKGSDLSSADKKAYGLDKDKQDIQNMYEGLAKLIQSAADKGQPITQYQAMIAEIADLDAKIGNDMGILRSGAEAHTRLP